MKLGTVIGRVTLSKSVDLLKGGRFLVGSPFSREQYAKGLDSGAGMGKDPSLVVYNDIGGGVGDVEVKRKLVEVLVALIEPMRQRRLEFEKDMGAVLNVLKQGTAKANVVAEETLYMAKEAMGQGYWRRELRGL